MVGIDEKEKVRFSVKITRTTFVPSFIFFKIFFKLLNFLCRSIKFQKKKKNLFKTEDKTCNKISHPCDSGEVLPQGFGDRDRSTRKTVRLEEACSETGSRVRPFDGGDSVVAEQQHRNEPGATVALKYLKELCKRGCKNNCARYLYFVCYAGAHGKRGLLMNWRAANSIGDTSRQSGSR